MGHRASPVNPAGSVAASQLATDLIVGTKILPAAQKTFVVTGRSGAGACSTGTTGLKVGDKVISVVNLTDATEASADFESTITVADQIQQSSVSNYSAKKFAIEVLVRS